MRKFFVFALFLIILLGCAKKEVKQEIKEIKVKIPPGEEKKIEPTFVSKNYQNRCYLQFLSFLSNRYNNFELDENFVASLSDEFEINELSRRKSIDRAISNYTELIKNISIPEEKNFINQRIGICKYKNGDFGSAYSILNEVYFRNKKEGIENEELNFYLALSYLSFKKDVLMAYEFLKSSSPHITTLPALDFYYLLSKVALWSGKTNEAKSYLNKRIVKIVESEVVGDLVIEHRERHIGKVIFIEDDKPVIVCGKGLLKVIDVRDLDGNFIKVNLRSRFK